MNESALSIPELCGQLIVGGFDGGELPTSYAKALGAGHRAGAILFRRNLQECVQIAALNRAIAQSARHVPFIGVDQEGGRVARLPEPFLKLPPMRVLATADDLELTTDAAAQVARELRALGFNLNFAPVMDVDSNPDNPVIGDRAFGTDVRAVMKHGVAFLRGLQGQNVLACAKHFPGHGDTSHDSHVELPYVEHDRQRLTQVELPPFRAASGAGVAAMMSAHVVYRGLDPEVPATMSRAICTSMLRKEIGFSGVLFSDDLEMGAVAKNYEIEEAATEAIWAGCDALLICHLEELQVRAHEALIKRAERDDFFRKRCQEASERSLRVRMLCAPPAAADEYAIPRTVGGVDSTNMLARIERAVGGDRT